VPAWSIPRQPGTGLPQVFASGSDNEVSQLEVRNAGVLSPWPWLAPISPSGARSMTTLLKRLAAACVTLSFSAACLASEAYASMDDAKGMLSKAVSYLKAHGKDKAFAEFMNPQGAFFDRDLRVTVLTLDGKFLANANNPRMVGKDATNVQDADGEFYIKERLQVVKAKAKGEQDYKFINPVTKKIEMKVTYFERTDDVVAVGAFKH
jgi:cytochrome c